MPIESEQDEIIQNLPYKEVVANELNNPAFKEILEFDSEGFLRYRQNGIRFVDLLKAYGDPYNAPIQVTDILQITQRAGLLKEIFRHGAELAGYPQDKIQVHYAAKANFKGPVVAAALKEVNIETSGELDLYDFQWLWRNGFVSKDKKVICNGFKSGRHQEFDVGYAERIIEAHREGIDVTPVLMQNELPFYQEKVKRRALNVGLRLKFGIVSNDREQAALISRFGFDWQGLQVEADKIGRSGNLKFTMLHAMVSAASELSPDKFVRSALYAAEKYAMLKRRYPSLTHLNLGGGIPSIDSGYNYNAFLVPYMRGVKEICQRYGVEPPTIVVESGSFISTDAESLVFRVVEVNRNTPDRAPWLTLRGSLTNLPDIWIQRSEFTIVAANNANRPAIGARFGDLTCDSNDVYPPKDKPNVLIHVPDKLDDLVVVLPSIGAYQDVISGVGGLKSREVFHNGLRDTIQVYIGQDAQGQSKIWAGKSITVREESSIVGFDKNLLR